MSTIEKHGSRMDELENRLSGIGNQHTQLIHQDMLYKIKFRPSYEIPIHIVHALRKYHN